MNETLRNTTNSLDILHLTLLIEESFTILPAFCGNTMILICLSQYKNLRSVVGILVGSLAVTDLLAAAIVMPMDILGQEFGFLSHKYYCLVRSGGYVTLFGVTVLTLMVLSVERFLALAYPLKYVSNVFKSKKATVWALVLIWVCMTTLGFAPLLGWNAVTSTARVRCTALAVFTKEYTLLYTFVYAFGTLIDVMFLIIVTLLVVKKSQQTRNAKFNTNFRKTRNFRKTYLVLLISGWFSICWGPYCVVTFIRLFSANVPDNMIRWTYFPCVLNIAFNWMIYGFGNIKLRRAMNLSLRKFTKRPYRVVKT